MYVLLENNDLILNFILVVINYVAKVIRGLHYCSTSKS